MTSDTEFNEQDILEFNRVEIDKEEIRKICNSALAKKLLTVKELRLQRSYNEFIKWYEEKKKLLRSSDKSRAISYLCGSPYKEFFEEVVPFRALVDEIAHDNTIIEFPCDYGNRDVIITTNSEKRFIEIVSSDMNYLARLRIELLCKTGHSPNYGPICKDKNIIHARPAAVKRPCIENERIKNAINSIKYKSKKKYNSNTYLLIFMFYGDLHGGNSISRVVSEVRKHAPPTQFSRIYLVTSEYSCARIQ